MKLINNYKLTTNKYCIYSFFIVLLFILHSSLFIKQVFAHVLKTDGEIGAVVHIDPEDDPVVGQQTTIYFDIKDRSGQFKADNCDCMFVVKKDGHEVYSQSLTGTIATYNFPERNVYTLELRGNPKVSGQFQPFTLTYDVRVARVLEASSDSNQDYRDIFIGICIAAFLIGGIIVYLRRKK